jgi:hypothetical protein
MRRNQGPHDDEGSAKDLGQVRRIPEPWAVSMSPLLLSFQAQSIYRLEVQDPSRTNDLRKTCTHHLYRLEPHAYMGFSDVRAQCLHLLGEDQIW